MSLYEKIDVDFKTALKAKDQTRVSVLRMLRAALKNREVEERRKLEEIEVARVINSQVKQRKDSIELYEKGGRLDLAEQESRELLILEEYLPRQMGAEELEAVLREVIAETGASGMKDMGAVMKAAMGRLGAAADGKVVNQVVRKLLSA